MKKIFTFLFLAALVITTSAQDVKLTEIWHHSTRSTATDLGGGTFLEGTAPEWMGATTERSMVTANGKMYVASRKNGMEIVIIDPATGEFMKAMSLTDTIVKGGLFPMNCVAATESGDLIVASLTTNTQAADSTGAPLPSSSFKAYHITLTETDDSIASIETIIDWNNVGDTLTPSFRIGDGMTFYGDMADGTTGYLAVAAAGTDYILRWNATNGVMDQTPQMFRVATSNPAPAEGSAVNFATAPQVTPVSENLLIVDGNNLYPAVYDLASSDPMAVEMVATFDTIVYPQTPNLNGCDYFEFKGRQFIVAVTAYWTTAYAAPPNSFEVFELINGDWAQAVSLGFVPADGLSATTATKNTSFAYPASVDVQQDTAFIYVMSANMGIAKYALSMVATGIQDDFTADQVNIYPNPATSVINFSKEMSTVQIFDISGRVAKEATNVSRMSVSELKGMYIVNATDSQGNRTIKKLIVQ
ncbi:T9SS type A sorting domain-containing protein [Maribellus sediminis]|uniref:T9SS type A sorting domain-containing protein n=1 Tax=Maribellus sediminis TaxID=2696285 RepID=UPI0014311900|nr:T9SS type A sorting domain-containing protein [Maribellus sediminis]